MAFNPKAVRGYNRNYKRLQGPARGQVQRRVATSRHGPYRKPVAPRQTRLPAKVVRKHPHRSSNRPFGQTVRTSGSGLRSDYPRIAPELARALLFARMVHAGLRQPLWGFGANPLREIVAKRRSLKEFERLPPSLGGGAPFLPRGYRRS